MQCKFSLCNDKKKALHIRTLCRYLGPTFLNNIIDENAEGSLPFSAEYEIMKHFHFYSLIFKPQVKVQLPIWKSEGFYYIQERQDFENIENEAVFPLSSIRKF